MRIECVTSLTEPDVYQVISESDKVIFEGSEQECRDFLMEVI